ncbi:MAG: hypothetical protein II466_07275 [Bacteroidales bacterium]|nr:hypothetical protein [Bacteroidales bacterium]
MEFDTKVRQAYRCETSATSSKDLDGFCEGLWDVFTAASKNVAEAGGGQFWLDYSNKLSARYLVCDVTDVTPDGAAEGADKQYRIKISSAKKAGYVADVILAILAIGFMWCVSKIVVPDPEPLYIGAIVAISGIGGLMLALLTRPFGKSEAEALKIRIDKKINNQ